MLDSHATWEEYRSELALTLGFVTEKMIDSLTNLGIFTTSLLKLLKCILVPPPNIC